MWISLAFLSCVLFVQFKTKYTVPYMYNKIKTLYNGYKTLDNTNGSNILYTVFNNYVSKHMVTIEKETITVSFPYGTRWYKIRFPRVRHPFMYNHIYDENGEDVSQDILSYMGPCHNFYGISTTPIDLGYSKLVFVDYFGEEMVFEKEQEIRF